ncbi:G-protein coupled receptors family 3 profile domain-containing protein [Plasmodiophora brassicae]|uniref:G-protein coupled receptors family 3 profile domain-containing protein n=1 Tax=Plasmodiophora brassicae TaxID=37360 RepID=A0A0G4J4G1_PLABS|nr:hypothetical protein PBRA_009112 [Plasmodiophora brassicae]SPR01606.1 unnamed protein product [Plasmodiophora brassicae]
MLAVGALLLAVPLASAFRNLSECPSCDGTSSYGNVILEVHPDGDIEALPMPSNSDDQYALIMQKLNAHDPTMAVMYLDVIWSGDMAHLLADMGTLVTADALAAPVMMEQQYATVNGVRVAAPYYVDTGFLYYRKDLLTKYGYASPPSTWGELEQMAAVIQAGERKKNPNFWGYVWQGNAYEGLTCDVLEVFVSHGAGSIVELDRTVSVNNPLGVAALARMVNWVGTISPPSVTNMDESGSLNTFAAGNAAFLRSWPYVLTSIWGTFVQNITGIALLPSNGGSTSRHGTLGGWMVGVNKFATMQTMAGQLVSELTSEQHQRMEFRTNNKMPVNKDIFMGAGLCAPYNPNITQICDVGAVPQDYIVPRWSTVAAPYYTATSAMVYNAVNSALLRLITPGDALTKLECQLTLQLHGRDALPMHCLTEIAVQSWASTTITALTVVALCIVVVAAGFISAFRNHAVMKAASPIFCLNICVGGMILLISNITAGLHPATYPGSCWATVWLTCIGFMVMMGALFVKHWRVAQIFNLSTSGQRGMAVVKITNTDVGKRVALLVALDVVVLGIWMGAQGTTPSYTRVMQESSCPCQNADLHQFVTACRLDAGGLWTVVVLHGILIVWGTAIAIRTRNIPMLLFNESKFMGLTTYNIALIMVLTLPVMLLAGSNPSMGLLVRGVAAVLVVTLTIVVLFGYKFFLVLTMTSEEVDTLKQQTVVAAGSSGKGVVTASSKDRATARSTPSQPVAGNL